MFVIGSHSIYEDQPDRFYRFPPRWLNAAARSVGQWIIYQEPRRAGDRGYYAVARVEQIVRDPDDVGMYLALIEPGSYLEFGRDVAFHFSKTGSRSGSKVETESSRITKGLQHGNHRFRARSPWHRLHRN